MGDGTDWLRKGFAGALVISAHATLLLWQPVVWRPGAQATHARVTVVLLPPGLVSAANPGPLTTTPLPPRPRATRRQPAAQRLIPPETSTPMTRNADSLPPAAAGQLSGIEPAPQRGAPLDLSYRPAPAGPARIGTRLHQEKSTPEDSALATGFARAQRADCRNAYAHLGLLAIPRLLFERKDQGCRW